MRRLHVGDHGVNLLGLTDVEFVAAGGESPGCQRFDGCAKVVRLAAGDGDMGAESGQECRDPQADACASTGDKRDVA